MEYWDIVFNRLDIIFDILCTASLIIFAVVSIITFIASVCDETNYFKCKWYKSFAIYATTIFLLRIFIP